MSPSATPATQSRRHCHEVPHLPPKVSIHATKCNACHAKGRVAATKRSTKASPASPCATPATQSGRHRRGFTATKRATRANPVSPSATLASMSPSTKIATQSVRRCHQVPCPAKGPQRHKSISAVLLLWSLIVLSGASLVLSDWTCLCSVLAKPLVSLVLLLWSLIFLICFFPTHLFRVSPV